MSTVTTTRIATSAPANQDTKTVNKSGSGPFDLTFTSAALVGGKANVYLTCKTKLGTSVIVTATPAVVAIGAGTVGSIVQITLNQTDVNNWTVTVYDKPTSSTGVTFVSGTGGGTSTTTKGRVKRAKSV